MAETERFDSNGNKIDNSSEKKKGNKLWIVVVALFVIYIALNSCLIVCHEDEYKLIRQFGRVDRTITDAGLYVKIPFIESVDTVPKKVLLYDLPVSDVITSDKKTMIVDCYVLWRVTDPLKFAQTLSHSIGNAENRIDQLVYNAMKNTISNMTQDEVIRSRDGKIEVTDVATDTDVENNDIVLDEVHKTVAIKSLTEEIMEKLGTVYEQYGIEIMTVEVKKLDLPDDNKQAVYTRMISERENIAAQYTAEGESQARIIRNTTDKEVSIMLSEANAKAEQIKAEGEAEYMKILTDSYNDESKRELYRFGTNLEAATTSMKGKGQKTLILPADSPIAEVFAGY